MKNASIFSFLITFFTFINVAFSQNCENIVIDKFTKDKGAVFYLEKYGEVTTTLTFKQRADYPSLIRIDLDAGNFRGDNSRSSKYVVKKISVMMYFIFEDGTTKYISQDQSVAYGTSIFVSNSDDIVSYLKSKNITDIRIIINQVDIQVDYQLPASSRNFFKKLLVCMGW